ncbi:MAG: hypothetical protein WCK29_03615 [archaeon]
MNTFIDLRQRVETARATESNETGLYPNWDIDTSGRKYPKYNTQYVKDFGQYGLLHISAFPFLPKGERRVDLFSLSLQEDDGYYFSRQASMMRNGITKINHTDGLRAGYKRKMTPKEIEDFANVFKEELKGLAGRGLVRIYNEHLRGHALYSEQFLLSELEKMKTEALK